MKTILGIIKYIIIFFVFQFIVFGYLSLLYGLFSPFLPDSLTNYIQHSYIFGQLHKSSLGFWSSLGGIIVFTSFFIIGFKLLPNHNIITKTLFGFLLVIVISGIIVLIHNSIIMAIIFVLIVISAIALLIFKRDKKINNNQKEQVKFEKNNKERKGFYFQTTRGYIHLENPYRGIYIQGGAGSGKTESIFSPIITQIAKN